MTRLVCNIYGWRVHQVTSPSSPRFNHFYIYKQNKGYLHIDGTDNSLIITTYTGWFKDIKGVLTALANRYGRVYKNDNNDDMIPLFNICGWDIKQSNVKHIQYKKYYASMSYAPNRVYLDRNGNGKPACTWYSNLEELLVALSKA